VDQSNLNYVYEKLNRENNIMEHQMNFNKAKFEGLYDRTFKKEYVQGNHPLVSINKLKYLN